MVGIQPTTRGWIVKRVRKLVLMAVFSLSVTALVTSCFIFGWDELVISGTVSGLVGEATLTLNDGQEFELTENGEFSFVAEFERNVDYEVVVSQWPGILGVTFTAGTQSEKGREISGVSIDFYHLVFFSAYDGTDVALWKTDGTPEGTLKVKDFDYIRLTRQGTQPNTAFLGTDVYFRADDGNGTVLWKSDGSAEGTVELGGEGASYMAAFDGRVFFRADDPTRGSELWSSNGTPGGTQLFADIYNGSSGSAPGYMTVMGGEMVFCAWYDNDGLGDHELWKTDGSVNGTVLVADIYEAGPAYPGGFAAAGDLVFFNAYLPPYGYELFGSDGTESGTGMVKDVNPVANSSPEDLTTLGDTVLFTAQEGSQRELWKSDGTETGTSMVTDINGASSSSPRNLTAMGGLVYFAATDEVNGEELWTTDGTAAGTAFVMDVNGDPTDSSMDDMQSVGGRLFFFVAHPDYGREPWAFTPDSSGYEGSAGLLKDINAGTGDSLIGEEG